MRTRLHGLKGRLHGLTGRVHHLTGRLRRDAGMVTSEYAMGIIAAVAFAVLLYEVVTSGQVKTELQNIVKRALSART
ncbi:DUF4244 domain-containing protein [Streptomyces thermodiastaticus]|jgi:hypothetical protein|uniref:DUF4244 domain-containing protein n=1 Tax=Streptomyces thermodiastaticus TaxID=44061 RepID=UPI0019CD474F|nr:DUF4244 domain-containing protein [Streptomyces thermodiastaticus]MCE7551760.1 DUF4244 domain-containing protein [Streptomyces thermodiastaticus]GHF76562.1 membrane protein [Streptomyces thermodiastaticus]